MDRTITNAMVALDLVTPAVIGLLLHYFYRLHKRTYLREWSLFWFWLAAFKLLRWITFDLLAGIDYGRADRLLLAAVTAVALLIAITQLGAGTFSAVRLRPLRARIRTTLTIAAVVAGVAIALSLYGLNSGPDQRLTSLNYITGCIIGLAYLACSTSLWRAGHAQRGSWILLTVALIAAGLLKIGGALLQAEWHRLIGTPLVLFDVILSGAIGIAMVVHLLDEERVAALSAADQVAHMVYHEELTGLANRSLLLDRLLMSLTRAERHNSLFALIFLDIDAFKPVNDTLGHDVGDELLKGVADRIRSIVRSEDTVARFGGDEFVILISELRSPEDTGRIGTKLTDAIRQPFQAGGHEVSVTTSVGIAIYPHDGTDADTLMRNADKAMYQAKEKGGNQFQLYSVSMNHRALEKLELEMSLRRGLEFRQMELHFQPILSASAMKLIGFEALLRWDHPTRGLLAADEFMPVAERSGMLGPISRFNINEACRQLASWQKKVEGDYFIAVNVSAAELREEDVFSHLATSLQEYQLDPRRIELEITETSAPQELDIQSASLSRLRDLGIRITVDDFGNRFASLTQLRNTAADAVKLSPVLTTDIDDPTNGVITYGVIGIAHGLKLQAGAEAITNDRQLAVLKRQGCDRFQGPLFSAPLPAESVPDYIRLKNAEG